jgi:hypothetical protein
MCSETYLVPTPSQQPASRPCASHAKEKVRIRTRGGTPRLSHATPSSVSIRGHLPRIEAKKRFAKSPLSGTPRRSRPLGRPAGRTVPRSLYPYASGHISRSHELPPVTFKNPRLRHPKKNPRRTQEEPRKNPGRTHQDPSQPTAGVPPHRRGPRMVQSLVSVPI